MSKTTPLFLSAALLATGLSLGCDRKSEAQIQAEAAAKAADDKVAALEKQLAEAKGLKAGEGDDKEAHEHLSKGQVKALERQLADAKRRADSQKKAAVEMAKAPSAPKTTLVDVPVGTSLTVKLAGDLATDKVQAGDAFDATLSAPVVVAGKTVWPAGALVRGVVTQSVPAGRLASGKGVLAVKLTEVAGEGIETETFAVQGAATGERNAKFIGGGAALGALVGILSDKKHQGDHALGGAAIGAAAGTAVAAGTANTVIKIEAANPVAFKLAAPEKISVKN
ncbi:MAG TPA: hypothetical protein VJ570_00305 [Holophagaceae bacterium]|nr:hypothetical protein [Holophagaceae bacterium]